MRKLSPTLWMTAGFMYIFMYAPIVVVIIFSFNDARYGGPWQGFTLDWYRHLLDNENKILAAKNTLELAAISTAISTVLGTLLGYGLRRYRFPGKKVFAFLMYIPVVIPDIVMAVSLALFFQLLRRNVGPFIASIFDFDPFQMGMSTMVISHVTFQIPFVAIVVRSRLSGLDPAIEEAAHDLGAGTWQTLRHVTLPLIFPGILAGAILAFTLSLDDFVVSFFTTGPGATTLPILIYTSVKRGITPDINALATIIVLASIVGTVAATLLQRNPKEGAK
ncbi:MAG TPA: ABC transporter permease [Kiritimatiellia bacterium]|nr:ABC transporter permease [Kiritimatiellia bacterium]HMP33031.1 ABC transporter permease [Kiritimatiellia bacterium]